MQRTASLVQSQKQNGKEAELASLWVIQGLEMAFLRRILTRQM